MAEAPLSLPRWKKLLFATSLLELVVGVCQLIAVWYLKTFNGYDGEHLYQYVC